MKIAIIQLSDIHIRGTSDIAHRYLPDIASIFNEVSFPKVDRTIVVFCGDIAYSGVADEYKAARPTLQKLRENIEQITGNSPEFIALPGNHDCDFSLNDAVRSLLVQSIPGGSTKLSDKSVINQCTKVQEHFWEFIESPLFRCPEKNVDKIYLEHQFEVGKKKIRFRCYNTAWVSQNPEDPGRMALPRQYFQGHDAEPALDLTISILHHPTNWLTPNRKREFDVVLDHCSDLALFGHEHLPEEYTKSDFDGHKVGYIYGGAFQERPDECSGHFNAIVVDLDAGAHHIRRYKRSGKNFSRASDHDDWIPLGPRSPEIIAGFRLLPSQVEYLEDPEIEFAHRSGRRLSLADIFVNPDFTILSPDPSDPTLDEGKLLRGERFDSFLRQKKKLLILGRERSGRTSLAKKVFWTLFREGIIPIILFGHRLKESRPEDIDELVQKAVTGTYDHADLTLFDQTDRAKRALIIDGLERARMTPRQRASLLNHMEAKFETIVAFGEPMMMVEEITSGLVHEEALPRFSRLEIRELGRAARRRMIRRWHSIGAGSDYALVEEKSIESERIIDTLLGKSFLPACPIFVLSFLQSIESSRPMDNIGSYGYHYEAFITNALSQHSPQIKLDIKYQFLSELAYHLFSQNTEGVDEQDFINFYKRYCEKYGIDPDRGKLTRGLLESRILELFDGAYRFKYPYAYYFFVARYFRDHIDEETTKTHVRELGRNLHVERNANIWIFLAHLSKNPFLIETIIDQARGLFAEFKPVALDDDVKFVREIGDYDPKLTLPSTSPEQNIEEHYDQLDSLDSKQQNKEEPQAAPDEDRQLLRKLDAMVKTIQVLGQVLKNFPGSLTASEKFNVVSEAINLGLRGLGFFLQIFDEGKEEMFHFFEERVAKRFGENPTDEELRKRVRTGLFWFVRLTIFGMIKLISQGVGAKGEEATYNKVVGALGTNSAKLLDISIALDTLQIPKHKILKLYAEFKDDLLNRHLVGSLVLRHLYLFPVANNVKDELCRKLGIAVEKVNRMDAAFGEHTKRIGTVGTTKSKKVKLRKVPPKTS